MMIFRGGLAGGNAPAGPCRTNQITLDMKKTYLSSARNRMITQPDKYIPLVGGVNEKKFGVPITFSNGQFTTKNEDLQTVIESQEDYSDSCDLGETVDGHVITIIPRPNTSAAAVKKAKAKS